MSSWTFNQPRVVADIAESPPPRSRVTRAPSRSRHRAPCRSDLHRPGPGRDHQHSPPSSPSPHHHALPRATPCTSVFVHHASLACSRAPSPLRVLVRPHLRPPRPAHPSPRRARVHALFRTLPRDRHVRALRATRIASCVPVRVVPWVIRTNTSRRSPRQGTVNDPPAPVQNHERWCGVVWKSTSHVSTRIEVTVLSRPRPREVTSSPPRTWCPRAGFYHRLGRCCSVVSVAVSLTTVPVSVTATRNTLRSPRLESSSCTHARRFHAVAPPLIRIVCPRVLTSHPPRARAPRCCNLRTSTRSPVQAPPTAR